MSLEVFYSDNRRIIRPHNFVVNFIFQAGDDKSGSDIADNALSSAEHIKNRFNANEVSNSHRRHTQTAQHRRHNYQTELHADRNYKFGKFFVHAELFRAKIKSPIKVPKIRPIKVFCKVLLSDS